jgi:hypothetical protein
MRDDGVILRSRIGGGGSPADPVWHPRAVLALTASANKLLREELASQRGGGSALVRMRLASADG